MPEEGNRIVVNLDQPQISPNPQYAPPPPQMKNVTPASSPPPPKTKRRGGCLLKGCVVLLILGGIVGAGLGIGGYFYWQNFKSKPGYSLALLIEAGQRDDQQAINELIDTDKVVEDYAAQVKEQAKNNPIVIGPLKGILEKYLNQNMPQIKEKAREEINGRIKEVGQKAEGKPFIVYALALPWVIGITEEGDKATASINYITNTIEIKMERNGDKWKIVGVKDDQAVNRIVERVIQEITTGGGKNK